MEPSTASAPAAPAPTAVEPTTPVVAAPAAGGLKSVLATLITSAKSKLNISAELTAARAQVATLTTERDTARAEVATVTTARDAAHAQVNAIAAFFGIDPKTLVGKDAAGCTALFQTKADALALDAIAGFGVDAAALPKASTTVSDPKRKTMAEFKTMPLAARPAFFRSGGVLVD